MISLRWRLSFAFASLVALVAGGISLAAYQRSVAERQDRARDIVAQRARSAASLYATLRRLPAGATLSDPRAPRALRRAAAQGELATYIGSLDDQPIVWAAAPVAGRVVFVRSSFAEDQRALTALRRTLAIAAGVGTVLGAAFALLIASGLSRRLRRAAATAARLGSGDLEARVGTSGRDEVSVLGQALDQMADSLRERIQREERFAADVAHELRTPLTGLVSAAELLGPGKPAALVRESVARLRALVADLLEIARLDSGAEEADLRWIGIADFARDVVEPYGAEVAVEASARVLTDPRRLERVVVNLLENAHRHGAPPIQVQADENRLCVLDSGPGFPAELLESATDRFRTGDASRRRGSGLGLAIASGQARVLSARLELANRPEGGAAVAIVFGNKELDGGPD